MYLAIQNIGYMEEYSPAVADAESQPSKSIKGLREADYYNACYCMVTCTCSIGSHGQNVIATANPLFSYKEAENEEPEVNSITVHICLANDYVHQHYLV